MIVKDLYIDNFDWHVRIFYAVTCYWTDRIIQELRDIDCPEKDIRKARANMSNCNPNNGITYSNYRLRKTVMVIGMWTDPGEFENSFNHEKEHFTGHLINALDLEVGGEEISYFSGNFSQYLFPINRMFLCDCKCHNEDIQRELYKCNCKH
jgi:hypothetical protein